MVTLVQATATITIPTASNFADNDAVKIGNVQYRFKNTMASANDVKIGASGTASCANLVMAVNGTGVEGTNYYAGTAQAAGIIASQATVSSNQVVTLTSRLGGAQGNCFWMAEVVDGGSAYTVAAFSGGSGDVSGSAGFISVLMAQYQINASVLAELRKLTEAAD